MMTGTNGRRNLGATKFSSSQTASCCKLSAMSAILVMLAFLRRLEYGAFLEPSTSLKLELRGWSQQLVARLPIPL
jgi:hypothetical protein